jgi:hypothetical protein
MQAVAPTELPPEPKPKEKPKEILYRRYRKCDN